MKYSSLTGRVAGEGSDAWIVHDLAVERRDRGDDIILLSIGDPDFETPAPIRAAATEALARGRTHYSPIGGEPALRDAIAARASRALECAIAPAQVTVFPGAQAALFGVAECLFDVGDEVIVAEPTYVTYEAVLGAPGARMVQVSLRPENGFQLEPEVIASNITPRTRGIMLNFPHNPTGACLTKDQAEAVAALCRRHDLWLVSDEVYNTLYYQGQRHWSPLALPGMMERGVLISSLSKSHAMTGWRCGWAVTPPVLAGHLANLARGMYFGVAQFVQDAAAVAVASQKEITGAIRSSYERRARALVAALKGLPGLTVRLPEAGMYLFADIRATGLDGKQFARGLLDATGVAVTPGEGFGPSGAGHVRITLGVDEARLTEAGRRIGRYLKSLGAAEPPIGAYVKSS
jgi:arginine:pyruvate transaminase